MQSREMSGLLLALLAGLLYTLSSAIGKELPYLHPAQLCLYRFIGIFFLSLPDTIKDGRTIILSRRTFVMMSLRSLFSATNMYLGYVSIQHLPSDQSTAIIFSVPIFVTIAAWLCLKEPIGDLNSVIALVALAGTMLLVKFPNLPPVTFSYANVVGLSAGLSSVLMNTCNMLMLRLVKNSSRAVIIFHLGWFAIIELLIIMAVVGDFSWPRCGSEIWWVFLLYLMSYLAQSSITAAIQRGFAGPITLAKVASELVCNVILQSISFSVVWDLYSIFGLLLVVFSIIFLSLKTWFATKERQLYIFVKLKSMLH